MVCVACNGRDDPALLQDVIKSGILLKRPLVAKVTYFTPSFTVFCQESQRPVSNREKLQPRTKVALWFCRDYRN